MNLLKYLPLVAPLAILLSGCVQKRTASQADPESDGSATDAAKLVFFGWEDFVSPDAIAAFTTETGIEVEHVEFDSFEDCRARLESSPGRYDIVIAEAGVVAEWAELKLIQPLDHSKLPLLAENIDRRYLNLSTDAQNKYSVPLLTGTTVIAYRSDFVTPKEKSWNFLWDEAIVGKAMLLDDPREIFAAGMLRNGSKLNSSDPTDYKAAQEALMDLVENNQVRFGEAFEILDKLTAGEIWATQAYSGDAAVYAAENPDIAIFNPVEGASRWLDNWVIARDSKHSDEAHAFINFMLRGDVAAMTSNFSRYASPNSKALPFLDESLRNDPIVYPPSDFLELCEVLNPRDAELERLQQLGMRELIMAIPPSPPPTKKLLPTTGNGAQEEE